MDNYYEHLYNAGDINMVLDSINDIFARFHKNMFAACHGRGHAMAVVGTVEYILKSLSYDSRTVELGKVAALLHDIGMITGRWNHTRKSAVLSSVIFDGSEHLLPHEKEMLIQAIDDHADGNNISSAVGAALLIADKVDFSKRRILPVETIDAWHGNLLEVEEVDIRVSDKAISINFITTEAFSKELLLSGLKKALITKSAEYLGCTCHFQFNGIEERFD